MCEYNQEACRLNAFDGRKSLIRSFPCAALPFAPPLAPVDDFCAPLPRSSKVGVRAVATLEPVVCLTGA